MWDNPAERAHRITVTTRELHPPTPTELNVLLAHVAARDPVLHVLLVLAATTGARRAQLLALRWDNIHHDTMRISFCAGWVEGPDGPVLAATKTKRRHSVDLDADTYTLLATLADDHEHGFVFSDDHGANAWKPNRVTKAFLRHRRNAGLRPFRLHDLRHFMATEMLRKIMQTPAPIPEQDHDRVQRDRSLPDPRALPTRVASVLADGN